MRFFVTGASGFVGSAVVTELLGAGHDVTGLVRSDRAAESVRALGAEPLRGTIEETATLRAAAAAADGVIHLAFNHDFSQFAESARVEVAAIEAIGDELSGSGRPLVIASGLLGLTSGREARETDPAPESPRTAGFAAALALAERGVRSSVVRLAPSVHDTVPAGFVGRLAGIARDAGRSGYVGDGSQRWPAVHRHDAARLFRLAAEKGGAGSVFHAAGEAVAVADIAAAVGGLMGVPTEAVEPRDAGTRFGFLAPLLALDTTASTERTRAALGWAPESASLLDDIARWDPAAVS
ncbi:SDR family oxidoreductase [Tsukamurella paurometabola]|uniref:NADH-flavin reductase n=1 Tax=Tsukamurella paurometabola TaxID=2061 RepID=A0A3P8JXW2_TSUPA|nr:SDR family oxidoreductase [Tsukamurella paurometabola]UEA81185.1 SDR family oxidoreductase [Tsukamurella paurometabola]VDR38159.1 Putative NADH-flavin reductase [Tsukamurella paurometabola]